VKPAIARSSTAWLLGAACVLSAWAQPLPPETEHQPAHPSAQQPAHPSEPASLRLQDPTGPAPELSEYPQRPPSATKDCHGAASSFTRYWELDDSADCGTFNIRGYKPTSLSLVRGNRVNNAPQSRNDTRDLPAADAPDYEVDEMRIQLSVRSKLATGLLFWNENDGPRDSLWFGYTQQSYWQIFNAELSRPFRTTDHEPELIYVAPTPMDLPWGWQLRYSGLALNHQSNGQSLPLSRSWNRLILMTGMEKDGRYTVNLRLWQRISDGEASSRDNIYAQDDNPGIEDTYGRSELVAAWHPDPGHSLALTLRHNLRPDTEQNGLTAWRLEWLKALDRQAPGLRLHLQIFSGYGESLIDYNYRRTSFSIGLSLVDF
jgi:phospholipase A1